MTIEMPDEILKSKLSLSAKLICSVIYSYPRANQAEVAKLLGVSRQTVNVAVQNSKKLNLDKFTLCQESFTLCQESFTPDLVVSKLVEEEKETKPLKAKTPTKEEVEEYGAKQGAAAIVDDFYQTYSDRGWMSNGEPIKNWKAMFRWWKNNKLNNQPAGNTKPKTKMSAEDIFYEMDAETYDN
jgi:DNA-binding XRE family transcriptional regulator